MVVVTLMVAFYKIVPGFYLIAVDASEISSGFIHAIRIHLVYSVVAKIWGLLSLNSFPSDYLIIGDTSGSSCSKCLFHPSDEKYFTVRKVL